MAQADKPERDEFFAVVDKEAKDERERNDSKVLYKALVERRDKLGASGQIPADDQKLSATILGQARQRSAQISSAQRGGSVKPTKGLPWWLILAWVIAIAGAVAAYLYF